MSSGLFDSAMFQNSYGTKEMREIFNDEARVQAWLDVEAALARAQKKLNIISEITSDEINKKADVKIIDFDKMKEDYEKTGHPIIPLVRLLKQACDGNHGEYVHWGATTQDIMDTGCILQVKKGLGLIKKRLEELEKLCTNLAKEHKDSIQAGRTHGQHAVPITFGYKAAVWVNEIRRHLERLEQYKTRLLVIEFSGAAGTLATIDVEKGFRLQQYLAEELGLSVPTISWHSSRDCLIEIITLLSLISGTVAKIANELVVLNRTEIEEVEQNQTGRIGSSTMPQKRNPMQFEHIVVLYRFIKGNANIMQELALNEHERDWRTWGAEMKAIEESFLLSDCLLVSANDEISKLKVNTIRMKSNLNITHGLIMTERVMMFLAEKIGRQTAHDILHEAARKAFLERIELKEILKSNEKIMQYLSEQEINSLLEPDTYTGLAKKYIEKL
jgi:3-carboxy-cis,cis-muconate cycloisomerase